MAEMNYLSGAKTKKMRQEAETTFEIAKRFKAEGAAAKWMANPKNLECASKDWYNFKLALKTSGEHGFIDLLFEFLNPTICQKVSKNWHWFSEIVEASKTRDVAVKVFHLLSKPENLKTIKLQFFPSMLGFARAYELFDPFLELLSNPKFLDVLVECPDSDRGMVRILQAVGEKKNSRPAFKWLSNPRNLEHALKAHPQAAALVNCAEKGGAEWFGWLSDPENTELAAKDWDSFIAIVGVAAAHDSMLNGSNRAEAAENGNLLNRLFKRAPNRGNETTRPPTTIFHWLSNLENAKKAARDWHGFYETVSNAFTTSSLERVLTYLSVPKSRDSAARNWHHFAELVRDGMWEFEANR